MSPIDTVRSLLGRLPLRRTARTEHPIAIAHDYLTQRGGAERVVLALHRMFPDAPIYTTLYDPETTFPEFADATVVTSPLNRIGLFRRNHRLALPVLPFASTALRVPAALTVVSSTGWAHGFSATGRSFVYCHSPARWLYLSNQYMGDKAEGGAVARVLGLLKPFLTRWDQWAARRRNQPYVGNSTVVRERIREVYGFDVPVVFPPHSVDATASTAPIPGVDWGEGEFFVIVSRLLPYKNVQHAVEAVRGTGHRLLVIGAGPLAAELRATAPENVRFASGIPDAQMRWAYSRAAAVLAVSYEDFGITPLEGAAYGKPTLALRAGGFLDTVREGVTGAWVSEPTPEAIRAALDAFDPSDYDAAAIRAHAETFSEERFAREIADQLREHGLLD